MLSKNEILEGLTNDEFIIKEAIYNYACKFHLYDDEDINKAFIEFLKNNYDNDINYDGLIYSKLNKEIIETLINIHEKDKQELKTFSIEKVLVKHYSIIKDMDYNFEELITDEDNLLMYKKIKHFSKKDPEQLLDLYLNNINDLLDEEENNYVQEILTKAMGIALVQTEKGAKLLVANILGQVLDLTDNEEKREEFMDEYMPYFIYPLCEYGKDFDETDMPNGKVLLKDVVSGKKFWITDIAFSSNFNYDNIYLYTRIITYHEISFSTGLNIIFSKKDEFIKDWIDENKKEDEQKPEIARFLEIYNEYINNNKGMKVISKYLN